MGGGTRSLQVPEVFGGFQVTPPPHTQAVRVGGCLAHDMCMANHYLCFSVQSPSFLGIILMFNACITYESELKRGGPCKQFPGQGIRNR